MSKKRTADQTTSQTVPKRRKIDEALVKIWDNLSDEDEAVRLTAAHALIVQHLSKHDTEISRSAARRLFRGVCSSRKAARPGFYTALTGALSMHPFPLGDNTISMSELLMILDAETVAEANISGQEERDHAFGRLLSCKALIDAGILFDSEQTFEDPWSRLLDIQCQIAASKPWLRQESGYILYETVRSWASSDDAAFLSRFAIIIIQKLREHKLIRSPEGIVIWLAARESFPHLKMPSSIWKFDNPFAAKDIRALTAVMKDVRTSEESDFEAQGSSVWSAKLHFAWPIILNHICNSREENEVTFELFWKVNVDEGLFNPNSSTERKYLGLLLLQWTVERLPDEFLEHCFTANVTACYVQALKLANDRYLGRCAQTLTDLMISVGRSQPQRASTMIRGLVRSTKIYNFDISILSKVLGDLELACSPLEERIIGEFLHELLVVPNENSNPVVVSLQRRNILNVVQRFVSQVIRKACTEHQAADEHLECVYETLKYLFTISRGSNHSRMITVPWDDATIRLTKERLSLLLEGILKVGLKGQLLFTQTVAGLESEEVDADQTITETLRKGWLHFKKLVKDASFVADEDTSTSRSVPKRTMALLFSLVLYQIYTGETSAVGVLEEIIETSASSGKEQDGKYSADHIVEVLLTFVSTPSKFLRRITLAVFEGLTSQVSAEGLESLTTILLTKETREGQHNLFEIDFPEETEDALSDSDLAAIGSDVEVIEPSDTSDTSSHSSSESDSHSTIETSSQGEDSAMGDEIDASDELDKALALALGTRKLTSNDVEDAEESSGEDADSDSNMSDSQMLALDEKLSEVFRNRLDQSSRQKTRKEEMRSAKESVANFKNRTLDMIEIFIRSQHHRAESLEVIVPIIKMVKATSVKQLSDRGIQMLKQYAQRCKGNKVPVLKEKKTLAQVYAILMELLEEVMLSNSSNAVIGIGSQMNILLCKTLVNAGEAETTLSEQVEKTVGRNSVKDERKALDEFISSFRDWLGNFRARRDILASESRK